MFQALAADINSATQIELSQLQQSFPQQKQKRLELVSRLINVVQLPDCRAHEEETHWKCITAALIPAELHFNNPQSMHTVYTCTWIQRGKAQHSTLCSVWWFIESIILRSLFILHILSENRQWINEKYMKNFYWLKYMLQVKMVILGHYSQQFTANTSELKTTQAK